MSKIWTINFLCNNQHTCLSASVSDIRDPDNLGLAVTSLIFFTLVPFQVTKLCMKIRLPCLGQSNKSIVVDVITATKALFLDLDMLVHVSGTL